MNTVKSELQKRAERAASLFPDSARKPIVIEFAGIPKAGKTTTLGQLNAFLKRCGFKVEVVIERASVCPIKDKKHVNFNIWTACTTLAQILEKTQNPPRPDDPQILILDRGIFDSICWLRMMERLQRLRTAERKIVEKFLQITDWRSRISGVILMTTSPKDAMQREQGLLPVVGGKGSIMNESVLEQMVSVAQTTADEMEKLFRIFKINTSAGDTRNNPQRTAEVVAETVLSLIEEHLQEDILNLPKQKVKELFTHKAFIDASSASMLVDIFHRNGTYIPRNTIESDFDKVQALPIVVVRNSSGQVLQLRRREKTPDSPLHEKIVIWAGGHVRREDSVNGKPILHCIVRELEEELRLRIGPENVFLLGSVYIDDGSSSKHVAIVYEWRAPTDDVEVALSNSEFFERRGTSLSGKFVNIEALVKDVQARKLDEPWSDYIVSEFLAKGLTQPKLF
ncbi:MAG: NUDIX domain-containing protein [Candidatus Brocadiales bacterium]|nr:NUDIX domain-containing protein [Candidatus Brocadiales bacterium]